MSLKKNTKRNSSVKIGDPEPKFQKILGGGGDPKHSWMNCSRVTQSCYLPV